MAASGGDAEMPDAPVHEMEKLGIQDYDAILKRVDLTENAHLNCGIDFGSTFSSVSYGPVHPSTRFPNCQTAPYSVKDINGEQRVASIAAFLQTIQDPDAPCELVFGARAKENPARSGHKVLGKLSLIKLSLVSENAEIAQDSALLSMTRDLKEKHTRIIKTVRSATPDAKFYVVDPLTGERNLHTLHSIDCVIREYLRFLWQSTKAHFASKNNLHPATVMKIFDERARASVSVPVISTWEETTMDNLRKLLHDAGFPRMTFIYPEAKASALFHLFQSSQETGVSIADIARSGLRTAGDIGGGTADITCLIARKGANQTSTELEEAFPGVGSFNGSQKLNELFKAYLSEQFPDGKYGMKRAEGFGIAVERDCVVLEAFVMKGIFDAWLNEILSMLKSYLEDIKSKLPGWEPNKIGLTGWGSLPPYVLSFFREHLQTGDQVPTADQVSVELMDTVSDSVVAQGNFLQLIDLDFDKVQEARADFHIEGCAPVVCQGDNLNGTISYETDGELCLRDPSFPLKHELRVKSGVEFGLGDDVGSFEIEVDSLQGGGFELQWRQMDGNLVSYLDLEYHLRLNLDELMPRLELTVPYGGRLDSIDRAAGEDMTWSIPLKSLYMHVASGKIGKHKGTTLDIITEEAPYDHHTEYHPTPGANDHGGWYEGENFLGWRAVHDNMDTFQ